MKVCLKKERTVRDDGGKRLCPEERVRCASFNYQSARSNTVRVRESAAWGHELLFQIENNMR